MRDWFSERHAGCAPIRGSPPNSLARCVKTALFLTKRAAFLEPVMYEVECAFRRVDGAIRFIRESRMDETLDDFCVLKVRFQIDEIYPPEKDTGAGMDWAPGGISEIHMRRMTGWPRWKVLSGDELDAAKTFLEEEYAEELADAEQDEATAVYHEVA